ncbi:protein fuzzy homolog [Chamaea fasciata]|uniref:protein fuzzy homolog n=1 Tax=Chamaea fasciata TaxID=190680 RepID=UPI00336A1CB8
MPEEEGAPCLLCLATASGLPLFCRPPRPQVPFSLVGALHGVHLFGAAAGAELREAATPTAHHGLGRLREQHHLDRAQPRPRPARTPPSPESSTPPSAPWDPSGGVPHAAGRGPPASAVPPGGSRSFGGPPVTPPAVPQERLPAFRGGGADGFGVRVLGGGGGAVLGTPRWGALSAADSAPLRRAAVPAARGALGAGPAARDLPVFLPNSSPKVPHRLLLLALLPGLGVALLCGPRPSLQHLLTQLVPQFWGPVLEQLRGCARPRAPPLPPEVLGYLLIRQGRTQSGIVKGAGQAGALPPQRRADALRHLYTLLAPQYCPELGGKGPPPGARLCYMALPTHTGCCLLRPDLLLLLLLPPGTPRDPLNPMALSALSALSHG